MIVSEHHPQIDRKTLIIHLIENHEFCMKPLLDCIKSIALSDGTVGIVDFRGLLDGLVFEPLNDPQYLTSFELTDHTIQWRNGADFAPEFLRDLITKTVVHSEDRATSGNY